MAYKYNINPIKSFDLTDKQDPNALSNPVDYIDFDLLATSGAKVGRLRWNNTDMCLEYDSHVDGTYVTNQLGQEVWVRCRNNTASIISNGKAVYVTGAVGNRPSIALAKADSETTCLTFIGIATQDIGIDEDGFVTVMGSVRGVNTNSFNAGDILYVSKDTAGELTSTRPVAPNVVAAVGVVTVKSGSGEIAVSVRIQPTLNRLSNVYIDSIADKDILQYDSSDARWENKSFANSGLDSRYLKIDQTTPQTTTGLFTFPEANIGISTAFTGDPQNVLTVGGNTNGYYGAYIQNLSSGDSASADIVLGADNDSLGFTGHYIDMGISGSAFSGSDLGVVKTVTINAGGTGYTVNDILTLVAGDSNCTIKVLTLSGTAVATVQIIDNGTGYAIATALSTTGGTGSGCKINVTALYDNSLYTANDGYMYVSGGNLLIGTETAGKSLKFYTNTAGATGLRLSISDAGLVKVQNGTFFVDGASDAVQCTIQGHSVQTNNIFVVENSGGTDVLAVSGTGVGIGIAPSAQYALYAYNETVSSNYHTAYFYKRIATVGSGMVAGYYYVDLRHTTGNANSLYGCEGYFDINASGAVVSGGSMRAHLRKRGTGSATTLYGVYADYLHSSGTGVVSTVIFYGNEATINADTTTTTIVGFDFTQPTNSGTLTNVYGLRVASVTAGATLNYAIYTNLGDVYFGDTVKSTGRKKAVVTKTADYTATDNDEVIVCNKTTAMTITLPAATGSGQHYEIKNINIGAVTVDGNSSDTIDGITTQVLNQWDSVTICDYAANAWVIL